MVSGFNKKLDRFRYMNPKQMEKWENLRSKGRKSYVIIYGILFWGIPVSLTTEFITRITKYGFSLDIFNNDHFAWKIIIRTIVFIFAGIFFGLYMWDNMEKKYQKSIENNNI
jgi:hypothetical protein